MVGGWLFQANIGRSLSPKCLEDLTTNIYHQSTASIEGSYMMDSMYSPTNQGLL